jgi:chromosome segregation ATPase
MSKKLFLFVVAVLLIGTSAPVILAQAQKKAEKSIESMRKTRDEIEKAKVQKDKTMAALAQLTAQQGDLKKSLKKFSDELKKLDKSAKNVRKLATEMRAKNQEFFKVWEQELTNIQSPDLQQKAGERRTQAMQQFEELNPAFQSTRESFVALMASLEDIQNYLSLDLSPSGIAAVADAVREAQTQNQAVDEGLAKIKQQMSDFAAEYRGGGA